MSHPWLAAGLLIGAAVGAAALAYWAVVISEGAYLGSRWVVGLYDRTAGGYDALKEFDPALDERSLVRPLLDRMRPAGRVLDVATGTGRLPHALLADTEYTGEVIGLDLSGPMLERAWPKVGGWWPRAQLVRHQADELPFDDALFDAVTMVEALEFTPNPRRTLSELVRVLRPGGVLLVTNRVGWEAHLLPGRAFGRTAFETLLADHGLAAMRTERWQTYYDLVWARKPGDPTDAPPRGRWPGGTRCPACGGALAGEPGAPLCPRCGRSPAWQRGYWDLAAMRSASD